MEDLEITTLPVADCRDIPKLRTMGYDSDGNAAQVINGIFIARQPFVPGTSEVFVNGLRYLPVRDYKELAGDDTADGFELPGIESSDEIILKAIPVIN